MKLWVAIERMFVPRQAFESVRLPLRRLLARLAVPEETAPRPKRHASLMSNTAATSIGKPSKQRSAIPSSEWPGAALSYAKGPPGIATRRGMRQVAARHQSAFRRNARKRRIRHDGRDP